MWEARTVSALAFRGLGLLLLLIPLLLLLFLRKLGKISSLHLPVRSERDAVYSLQLLWFGLLLAGLSHWAFVPAVALNRILLAVIGIGILSLANRFLNKASAHMALVTALGGVYVWEAGLVFLWAAMAAMGLVWFARSSLKAHTVPELLSGFGCGLLSFVLWACLV